MQLAFSTNAYTRFALSEALGRIREAGFGAVELLADVPQPTRGQSTGALIAQMVRDLERLGLRVSNVDANSSFGYFRDAPPEAFFEPSLISPNRRGVWTGYG